MLVKEGIELLPHKQKEQKTFLVRETIQE